MALKKSTIKGVTKLSKIKIILSKLSSIMGQIVFFLISLLLIALLVYVIVSVILKDIAKIIGIDAGAQSGKESYQYLRDLSSSGYDAMLNATELIDYHAFEYAVLMDAARFLEETGTERFEVTNTAAIDLEFIHDGSKDREEWAFLAALAFCKNPSSEDGAFSDSQGAALNLDAKPIAAEPEPLNPDNDYSNDFINTSNYNTEHTAENLFYYSVYNEYTKENSLYPYMVINRAYDIVRYYVEYREDGNIETPEVMSNGIGFNLKNVPWLQQSRFEYGTNPDYAGLEFAYDFILRHLYPLEICRELNVNNIHAYEKSDPMFGSGAGPINVYDQFGEKLYYTTGQAPTLHKIPLRILLDRFLPNAVLLSSWRILKDDTDGSEDVVDQIQKIYSEACLTDETSEGEKLLVKDVGTVNYAIDENTKATQLFDKVVKKDSTKSKYLDGEETSLIYEAYAPLFDSRIWATETEPEEDEEQSQGGISDGNTSNVPTPPEGDESIDLAASQQQTFEGTFAEDVLDDIKLALTHYSNNSDSTISVESYNKLMEEVESIVQIDESNPTSNGEFIIYTPLPDGGYLAKCKLSESNQDSHYSGSDENKVHKNSSDPYSASTEVQKCFVPFMRIAYTQRNGLRITAIIINDREEFTGYVIKGREIADYSNLSNKNTFAVFETRDMQCTTVRHWKIATTGEQSQEKWFVEDAYEGLNLNMGSEIGDFILKIKYIDPLNGTCLAEIPLTNEYMSFTHEEEEEILYKVKINGYTQEAGVNTIEEKDTAVVRTNDDPMDREYSDEMLTPPDDAALKTEEVPEYQWNTSLSGGEGEVLNERVINLKKTDGNKGMARYDTASSSSSHIVPVVIDTSNTGDLSSHLSLGCTREEALAVYLYLESKGESFDPARLSDSNLRDRAMSWMDSQGIEYIDSSSNYDTRLIECDQIYSVVYPTRMSIIPITQEFWDKKMRFYLARGAKLWSSHKEFNNDLYVEGEFVNRDNFMYIVNSNPYCKGLNDYFCTKDIEWRCKMYAPIFAGNDSANTNARETDVLLILSEWLEASEQGLHAANHYIRDLYALVNYSKGIEDENGVEVISATTDKNGKPYIYPSSYEYLYVPDEILKFDDTTSEMAFWQDRLICTPSDPIDQTVENYLRSQAPTFTWQVVDYDLYEECQNGNGTAKVYPLWMFGDQMSRTMYALASNASMSENEKVFGGWGGYASGMHAAADLYGRNIAKKIYAEIYGSLTEPQSAKITSEYSAGGVGLSNTEGTSGEGFYFGDNEYSDTTNVGSTTSVVKADKVIKIMNKAIEENDTSLVENIIDIICEARSSSNEDVELDPMFGSLMDEHESVVSIDKEAKKREIIAAINEGNKKLASEKLLGIFNGNDVATMDKIISSAGNDYVPDVEIGSADIAGGSTAGTGLYFNQVPVTLRLGGKDYTFSGTAAATYAYELYRQTLILKDGEKAEETLKEQLETEMKWTALRAVAPGIVTEVKADARGGFTVRITHSENVSTGYLHMKRYPLVQEGQYVGAGTLIGYEGTTGNSGTFHVHFTIRKKNDPTESQELVNPVTYLYPFFTPFYYEEKAAEANYALDSEYMSTTRTVFPYGQVSTIGSPFHWSTDTDDGIVKIKNYVPFKTFIEDTALLYDEDSGFEKFVDYSKLPTKNVNTSLGASSYNGEILKTNPNFFNESFISAVIANGNKIEGVKANWAGITAQPSSGDSLSGTSSNQKDGDSGAGSLIAAEQ